MSKKFLLSCITEQEEALRLGIRQAGQDNEPHPLRSLVQRAPQHPGETLIPTEPVADFFFLTSFVFEPASNEVPDLMGPTHEYIMKNVP